MHYNPAYAHHLHVVSDVFLLEPLENIINEVPTKAVPHCHNSAHSPWRVQLQLLLIRLVERQCQFLLHKRKDEICQVMMKGNQLLS